MQKLSDNVYLLSVGEDVKELPQFKDKVVFYFSIHPFPEKIWPPSDTRSPIEGQCCAEKLGPSNNQMIAFSHWRIGVLCGAGILPRQLVEDFGELSKLYVFNDQVELVVQFPDLKTAEESFERAIDGGFVDIYLYNNGKMHKYYD